MKRSNLLITAMTAFAVTGITLLAFFQLGLHNNPNTVQIQHVDSTPAKSVLYTKSATGDYAPLDFSAVAAQVTDAVVHIRSTADALPTGSGPTPSPHPFFDDDIFQRFFGPQFSPPNQRGYEMPPRVGSGSGVIIDPSGYIVTNHHVIKNAADVEVTMNDNRTFKAKVIGEDPTTDLAVLKIEGEGLPTLAFTSSDDVRIGEWVLAIGNPFNLNSTVTAGIVSAKARNINILKEQYAVESFIQTDAAINPGNSGGALVNLNGGLIGINTAIASPTGSYSGYGFAVPSNIVKKVIEDLIEYGTVQRGYLGVLIRTVNSQLAESEKLKVHSGVLVDSILGKSAAGEAGVRKGDVVVAVDGKRVMQSNELQELVARKRPGDDVQLTINRSGREKDIPVTLGGPTIDASSRVLARLGISLQDLSRDELRKLGIEHGVMLSSVQSGALTRQTGIREGFVITHLDREKITSAEQLTEILENKKGGVMIEGVYPGKRGKHYYAFGLEG